MWRRYQLCKWNKCSRESIPQLDSGLLSRCFILTQVVSFAGELLKKAEDLLVTGLHTSEIVAGYKAAFEKAVEILPTLSVHTVRINQTRVILLPLGSI